MSEKLLIVCPHCHTTNRLLASRLTGSPKCGECSKSIFEGKPVAIDQTNFQRHIKNNDIPVLVYFWAEWCAPCKAMAPQFNTAATHLEPSVRLIKVDMDQAQLLASQYRIQSIPTLILFLHGNEISRNSGAMTSQQIIQWVQQNMG